MKRLFIVLVAAFGALAANASDQIPGAPQDRPIALVGATVHTISGADIAAGTVLFDAGRITAVGSDVAIPDGALRIDATGKHVYPGLIDGASVLGLAEVKAVRASLDFDEVGDITPEVHAARAVNPDSKHLPVTRANGILSALTMPTGGLVPGMAALIHMDGWTNDDLVVSSSAALVVTWPTMRIDRRTTAKPPAAEQIDRRDAQINELSELLAEARAYRGYPADLRLEAVQPVLTGDLPIMALAQDEAQVQAALDWAEDEGVRLIVAGSGDIWRAADELARANVPVVYWNSYFLPRRADDPYDTNYTAPLRLYEAGVEFCMAHTWEPSFARYLPEEAGRAVAYGLPADVALRAITLAPARIFGVEDQLGSIEVGKEATLIVADGDILEITSHVEWAFIEGRTIDLSSHHTQLYDKYRTKYEQLGLLGGE